MSSRLNEIRPRPGRHAGQGGDFGDGEESATTAELCREFPGVEGYLAFDYFMPDSGAANSQVYLVSGGPEAYVCGGRSFAVAWLQDFALPPAEVWSTQCVRVTGDEPGGSVTVAISRNRPHPRVRNLRFVRGCEGSRQLTRYFACESTTSPRECE